MGDNCREAKNEHEAIHIGNYHQDRTIAIGNQEKQEWIIAPESYNLEDMR